MFSNLNTCEVVDGFGIDAQHLWRFLVFEADKCARFWAHPPSDNSSVYLKQLGQVAWCPAVVIDEGYPRLVASFVNIAEDQLSVELCIAVEANWGAAAEYLGMLLDRFERLARVRRVDVRLPDCSEIQEILSPNGFDFEARLPLSCFANGKVRDCSVYGRNSLT